MNKIEGLKPGESAAQLLANSAAERGIATVDTHIKQLLYKGKAQAPVRPEVVTQTPFTTNPLGIDSTIPGYIKGEAGFVALPPATRMTQIVGNAEEPYYARLHFTGDMSQELKDRTALANRDSNAVDSEVVAERWRQLGRNPEEMMTTKSTKGNSSK